MPRYAPGALADDPDDPLLPKDQAYIPYQIRRCTRNAVIGSSVVLLVALTGVWLAMSSTEEGAGPWAWLGAAVAAASIAALIVHLRYLFHPEWHPLSRQLAKYGTLPEVLSSIQGQLASPRSLSRIGGILITDSWMFVEHLFAVEPIYLPDAIWIHHKAIRKYRNGIPSGTDHQTEIRMRDGRLCSIDNPKNYAAVLENELKRRLPWCIFGSDAQLEKTWSRQRDEVIRYVDQRRPGAVHSESEAG